MIKKIEGQVNYSYNDHIMDNYSLRKPSPELVMNNKHEMVLNHSDMEVTRRTLNSRLAMTSEWDKLSLITGVDSQFNKHGGDMVSPTMNMPFAINMKFQSYGAFGELGYQFNDTYKLVTGARVDQVKIDALKLNDQRKETLPSAFIRLESQHPEHNAKSYIGLGYVERVPDYWELFSTAHGNTGMTKPTFNDLKTEKTLQLDLGYQYQHGPFSAWTSAYAGLINDFILLSYHNHPTGGMDGHSHGSSFSAGAKNVDATIAGAEAGVGYQFTDAIQADLSAMYAWGENTDKHQALPQIAPLEGRLNLRYVQDQYSFGLLWRAVAKQDRISLNQGNIVGYDTGESKGFTTLALNASYNIQKNLNLSVGVDNVFDKTYTEHLNKLGVGADGQVGTQQFNNTGLNYWARVSMKF